MSVCGNFAIVGTRGGHGCCQCKVVLLAVLHRDATDEKEERQTKQVAGDVSRTMRARISNCEHCESNLTRRSLQKWPNWGSRDELSRCQLRIQGLQSLVPP
jgi:hypothetical protein